MSIYLLKVNNGKIETMYEICSKLTTNTPEKRPWRRSIVDVSIVDFKRVNDSWKVSRELYAEIFKSFGLEKFSPGHIM